MITFNNTYTIICLLTCTLISAQLNIPQLDITVDSIVRQTRTKKPLYAVMGVLKLLGSHNCSDAQNIIALAHMSYFSAVTVKNFINCYPQATVYVLRSTNAGINANLHHTGLDTSMHSFYEIDIEEMTKLVTQLKSNNLTTPIDAILHAETANPFKQRAYYTMMTILYILMSVEGLLLGRYFYLYLKKLCNAAIPEKRDLRFLLIWFILTLSYVIRTAYLLMDPVFTTASLDARTGLVFIFITLPLSAFSVLMNLFLLMLSLTSDMLTSVTTIQRRSWYCAIVADCLFFSFCAIMVIAAITSKDVKFFYAITGASYWMYAVLYITIIGLYTWTIKITQRKIKRYFSNNTKLDKNTWYGYYTIILGLSITLVGCALHILGYSVVPLGKELVWGNYFGGTYVTECAMIVFIMNSTNVAVSKSTKHTGSSNTGNID